MLIACYIGNHSKDTFSVRLGWVLTRLFQRGRGVRKKSNVQLNKNSWMILDIPTWQEKDILSLYEKTKGKPYDLMGAIGSGITIAKQDPDKWFCNEWVFAPWIEESWQYGPAAACEIAILFDAKEITNEFFG
jgi:hypothetical protein